jgi:hypothetical protein
MKKIMFVLLATIMLGSMFVYVKQAKALSDGMTLDPVEKVYDPPYGGPNDFDWNLTITTTHACASWEAKLLWNPGVIRILDVSWGNFFNDGVAPVANASVLSSSGDSIQLGQYFTAPGTVTGSGWLATLHYTFVLPGYTQIYFLEANVTDDSTPKNSYDLLPPGGDTEMYCRVKSNLPHPAFYWYTDDGINPCPKHDCYDQGRITHVGTPVHFNGSASYDVGNVVWNDVSKVWEYAVGYPDIVEWVWDFNDGYYSNDIRLYHGTLPRGVIVHVTDADAIAAYALVAFMPYEMHDETVAADGAYTGIGIGSAPAWEGVYNDTDLSGNVTIGDYRYIPADTTAAPACAYVVDLDPDIGLPLVAFNANEKHADGIISAPDTPDDPYPGYINGLYDNWEPIYLDRQYKDTVWTDPGYGIVNAGAVTWDHMFSAYNYDGWDVSLTVYDSEGQYWNSDWRYGGPELGNIVPMWRDLAIVDIWASLPPYYMWDETGTDWGDYWFFDSSDFWIPNTADPYWNYKVDFPSYGYDPGETVKSAWMNYGSEGLYVLVTANNFGSTPEKARVNLYAFYIEQHAKPGNPPAPIFNIGVEKIGTWAPTINPGAGTGWGLLTIWMPPKNGTYLLFATIQPADDTEVRDLDKSNDYFLLSRPICNIAVWDKVNNGADPAYNYQLLTNIIFASYMCDMSRNGKVGPEDFAMLSAMYGNKPPF